MEQPNSRTRRLARKVGANDPIKSIILDEEGFWKLLLGALKIMTPIVKLLHLMDGSAPAMGKLFPRMRAIRQKIEASTVSWKAAALKYHDECWVYLKSDMHIWRGMH